VKKHRKINRMIIIIKFNPKYILTLDIDEMEMDNE